MVYLRRWRYLLGSGGVSLVSNNQSLEACWRWDLHACTSGSQLIQSNILRTPTNILPTPSNILCTPSNILCIFLIFYIPYLIFFVPPNILCTHTFKWACCSAWPICSRPWRLPAAIFSCTMGTPNWFPKLAVYGPANPLLIILHSWITSELVWHNDKVMWQWYACCWLAP